ncbi:hypothetical protein N9B46_04705 [Mariniblastus sp.]|nr:hypothetical protein [Mariniblastus sp.]MDA7926127.1 hypothetical protein [Mariniblastus sp.]MDB4379832.1 hypothetical protein [Mariniblastus sp.]
MQSEDDIQALSKIIGARKTLKVLGDVAQPVCFTKENIENYNQKVIESIKTAGWAPFHYNRDRDELAEPWRVYVIWHEDCQTIASCFHDWFPDVKASNKLPAMLSACGALIITTWLPQFRGKNQQLEGVQNSIGLPKQITIDDEHLAAAAAMVQNLLLLLTANSMGTYWSSGGQFRTPAMFEKLGINQDESFLSGVFVEYPSTLGESVERISGKQRNNRSQDHAWLREVQLNEG